MGAMLLLLLCLAAGIVLRQSGRLTDTAPAALNSYVIHIALPALALGHLHLNETEPRVAGLCRWRLADARCCRTRYRVYRTPHETRGRSDGRSHSDRWPRQYVICRSADDRGVDRS